MESPNKYTDHTDNPRAHQAAFVTANRDAEHYLGYCLATEQMTYDEIIAFVLCLKGSRRALRVPMQAFAYLFPELDLSN